MGNFFAKNKKWVIIAAIAVLLAVAAVVVISLLPGDEDEGSTRSKKVDLRSYIQVVETGVDTQGYLQLDLDYVAVAKALDFDEMDDIRQLQSIQQESSYNFEELYYNLGDLSYEHDLQLEELQELFNSFYFYINDNGAYSNGDTAIITFEVNREAKYGKKIRGGEFEYQVSNLQELTTFFPNFEYSFEGFNGSGTLQCTITDEYEYWHDYISFYCHNDGYLTNGDEVEITAVFDASEYDYVWEMLVSEALDLQEQISMTVTVSGLGDPLTLDTCTDAIIDQAEQIVKDDTQLADPTLEAQVSMVYFVEDGDERHIVVALEFPDEAENRCWNHIRYLANVRVNADGELEHDGVTHVLSGNGFDAAGQEDYILTFGDFRDANLTKLR